MQLSYHGDSSAYHGDSSAFLQREQPTQLCYRGVSYQPKTSVIEAGETVQLGYYRGVLYPIKRFHIVQPQPSLKPVQLRYRGVTYQQ